MARPWLLRCACDHPGWIDAGCVYHGIKSNTGQWDGEKQFEELRRALLPDRRVKYNIKWGD